MDQQVALGFDIGGSRTKLGLVNPEGRILELRSFPTNVNQIGVEAFIARLFDEIHALLGLVDNQVVGIGATFLGWIDEARTGPFLCMNAPILHGINLRQRLSAEFGLPLAITDDTTAHVLAEYVYGAGIGSRRFMTLAMGTGLSAGCIINGHPLRFTGGCIGDSGHLILRPEMDVYCTAGCRGCAEALIGVSGIERLAQELTGKKQSAKELIQAAREGSDPISVEVMRQIGVYTGELLASLSHIFLPEVICLTGGTARVGSVLLEATRIRFTELVGEYHRLYAANSGDYYHGVQIVTSSMESETGVIGSVVELFFPQIASSTTNS